LRNWTKRSTGGCPSGHLPKLFLKEKNAIIEKGFETIYKKGKIQPMKIIEKDIVLGRRVAFFDYFG
jgi:hypothetical protein